MQPRRVYPISFELLEVAYVWKHDGGILQNNQDGLEKIIIDYNRLTVHNVTMLDGGDYECVVKFSVNEISAKTNVVVEGATGAPGGVQVVYIGKRKALIEWNGWCK
ncbi:hypothetical protein GQX74_015268 [Glossina fuscipes]|nr:hypothetical protein GQX74_015268 [Glossina fuscipes]